MNFKLKDNQMIFDVSEGFNVFKQRTNDFKWTHPKNPNLKMSALSMCNVTSMVMAFDYLGYRFPSGIYKQPEDNLCDFIFNNKEVLAYYEKTMPALYKAFERGEDNAFCPNEIHLVLAYGANKWLGCTSAVTFHDRLKITDIIKEIIVFNRPVVMSGTFPYVYNSGKVGTIGHINVLVGIIFDTKRINVNSLNFNSQKTIDDLAERKDVIFIFDDPYGDYKQNFKAGTENDVLIPYTDFIKYYKELNNITHKMGHIFKNAAATI